jgi:predicted DCC family thiol-disulfide oxidoreductase YuxK
MESNNNKVKVYYDGLCHLCAREMAHYRKLEGSSNIDFVDITDDSFNPTIEGLDPIKVNKFMHVRDADGAIKTKVEAFRTIWNVLPKYRKIIYFSRLPVIKQILDLGYEFFAYIRPYLPKRVKGSCDSSPYCQK